MVDGPGEDVGWTMNETRDGFIAGGKLSLPGHGGDVLIVKFDKDGKYLWSRIFGKAHLDEIEEIKPTPGGYALAGVTRVVDPAGDFLVAKIDKNGFIGGVADPFTPFPIRTVVSITPLVQDFRPKVIDVSTMITVEAVEPTVVSPQIRITEIHRNE
jgi:hypothetical protein